MPSVHHARKILDSPTRPRITGARQAGNTPKYTHPVGVHLEEKTPATTTMQGGTDAHTMQYTATLVELEVLYATQQLPQPHQHAPSPVYSLRFPT